MKLNPPSIVRTFLYVSSVFINAMMGVFLTSDIQIPVGVIAILSGFNAVVALIAGANVTPDEWKD
jgi:hypothetical protein